MTEEKLKHIISQGESLNIEFKQCFNRQTIETLVAFANTKGGKIILGISDTGRIAGIKLVAESIQNWINEIKNKTSPQLIPDINTIKIGNKELVVLSIQEYPVKPVATQGKYYKRITNSNHLIDISELVNMHLRSFNTSWDYYTNNEFKITDISLSKVQQSIDLYNQTEKRTTDNPITFLLKNELMRNEKLTNASFLLFTEKDTIFSTIELGRFQTNTIIKDSLRSKSDILTQIDFVLGFVKKHINKEIIITEKARNVQKWQYPLEAIREIVINMVIHRDYRASSDSIVKIFDNRIEFYNPGRLPDSITVEDLLANNYKSTPRNKLIADFCKNIGLIEKYGSGIQRIVEYFKNANLPIPEFKNISEGFVVTVFSDIIENVPLNVPLNVSLNDRQKKIIQIINDNSKITQIELSETFNVNRETIKRDINKLQKANIIKRTGSKKTGYWKVFNEENEPLNVPLNEPLNVPLNDRQKKIIQIINDNSKITQIELSETLNVNRETIKRDINKLQKVNIIKRIGSKKTGYWKIIT